VTSRTTGVQLTFPSHSVDEETEEKADQEPSLLSSDESEYEPDGSVWDKESVLSLVLTLKAIFARLMAKLQILGLNHFFPNCFSNLFWNFRRV
jgi:hypothetical protein